MNVRPRPSQGRALIPLSYRSDFWRKGQDSNLQATRAVVFKTTALPVRLPFHTRLRISDCGLRSWALCSWPFALYWQGRSDSNRESRFWRPAVCQLAYVPKADFRLRIEDFGFHISDSVNAHHVNRERPCLIIPHSAIRNLKSEISMAISNQRSIYAKK